MPTFSSDMARRIGRKKQMSKSPVTGFRGKAIVLCDSEALFCVSELLYISPLEGGYLELGWLVHVIH